MLFKIVIVFSSGEWTRTTDLTGYEPGELPLLYPAIYLILKLFRLSRYLSCFLLKTCPDIYPVLLSIFNLFYYTAKIQLSFETTKFIFSFFVYFIYYILKVPFRFFVVILCKITKKVLKLQKKKFELFFLLFALSKDTKKIFLVKFFR